MKKCKLIIDGNVYTTNATLPSCEIEETTNVDGSKSFTGKYKWKHISFDELKHNEDTPPMNQQLKPINYIIIIYGVNEVYKLSKVHVDMVYNEIEFSYATIV